MQGSSGHIFSRKGAEIFIKNGIPYVEKMDGFDDYDFRKMRVTMGVSINQSASKFMSGHKFVNEIVENLYETLEYCPKNIVPTVCYGTQLFNPRHLTAYHSLKHCPKCYPEGLKEAMDIVQKQAVLHPDMSFYFDHHDVHFCKKNADDFVI